MYTVKRKLCRIVYVADQILIDQLLIQMLIDQLSYLIPLHDRKHTVKISRYYSTDVIN